MIRQAHHHRGPARRPISWLGLAALGVMLGAGGCGDDDGGSAPPPATTSSPVRKDTDDNRRRGQQPQAAPATDLSFYRKIEAYAADDEEAKRLRHTFKPGDFEPDITGDENRNPFRSYVIRQPGLGQQDQVQEGSGRQSEFCTSKNLVAPNYSLRDLRLVGIVLRGTKSYALFRDTSSYGHIVRKGDCLGQEKARVAAIRTGFVSLEVIPEVAPNQPPRPPQERAIQLYPDELTVEPLE